MERDDHTMLGAALDVFRLRQYFNVITRTRELAEGVREDGRLLAAAGRALARAPPGPGRSRPSVDPFPPVGSRSSRGLGGRRVGLVATGGSGALASVVGVAHAFEETGIRAAVVSVCSGSALFGFPISAGLPATEVAAFSLALRPEDYVDVAWSRLATLLPRAGRGFAGVIDGARIEATYRRLLGDRRLGDLPIPAYAPIWSVEHAPEVPAQTRCSRSPVMAAPRASRCGPVRSPGRSRPSRRDVVARQTDGAFTPTSRAPPSRTASRHGLADPAGPREGPGRPRQVASARRFRPSSMRRIMGKSPNSLSTRENSAPSGWRQS